MKQSELIFDKEKSALLVIDMQSDFLPGGPLAVPGADQIVSPVADLMEAKIFDLIIATQDWHPPDHVSFASNHPGRKAFERIELYGHEQTLWPDHCVQGTAGANLHQAISWASAAAIIRKGMDPAVDSYSAFCSNWDPKGNRPPTGLAGYLKNRRVEEIFVCGLARDFCVKWTAQDAVQEGLRVNVIWDLCRSIASSDDELDRLRRELSASGVEIVTMQRLWDRRK